MPQNYVFDVPVRDVVRPPRRISGAQKLADTTSKICKMADGITKNLERIQQSQAIMRAHNALQSPEAQAMRDRAAFDQAWRDRNERQRQQIKAMQDAADRFFKRTTR